MLLGGAFRNIAADLTTPLNDVFTQAPPPFPITELSDTLALALIGHKEHYEDVRVIGVMIRKSVCVCVSERLGPFVSRRVSCIFTCTSE